MLASNFIKSCLITLIFFLLFSPNVYTADMVMDGNKLLEYCLKSVHYMDAGERFTDPDNWCRDIWQMNWCSGSVQGVQDIMGLLKDNISIDSRICFPKDGISNGQAIRIVVKVSKG